MRAFLLLLAGALCANAQTQPVRKVIAQVADGGGWRTGIVLVNTGETQASASLAFLRDGPGASGSTSAWTLALEPGGVTSGLALAGNATVFLQTPGTGREVVTGWAELLADPAVEAYAIFRFRDTLIDQEATALAHAGSGRLFVPFDNTGALVTSTAVVNPEPAEQTVELRFRAANGLLITEPLGRIPARGHLAFAFPERFPRVRGLQGVAEFVTTGANGRVAVLALRFNGTGAFTSVPVYTRERTSVPAADPPPTGLPPAISFFVTDNPTITAGGSALLRWSITGADSASIDNGIGAVLPSSGTRAVAPAQTTIYRLTATNTAGSVAAVATVSVVPAAAPDNPVITRFEAAPASIVRGQTARLTWTSTFTANSIEPGIGAVAQSGQMDVAPRDSTAYTLRGQHNDGRSAQRTISVTVTVPPPPPPPQPTEPNLASFTADPPVIFVGQTSALRWSATGVTRITITPGNLTSAQASGSLLVSPAETTAYTIRAENAAGASVQGQTSVTVVNGPPAEGSICGGTLRWSPFVALVTSEGNPHLNTYAPASVNVTNANGQPSITGTHLTVTTRSTPAEYFYFGLGNSANAVINNVAAPGGQRVTIPLGAFRFVDVRGFVFTYVRVLYCGVL